MKSVFFPKLRPIAGALAILLSGAVAQAGPHHGIAMYGDPALPHDFVSLPYANPDAPKGGRIVLAESGGFDSLHPFIRKGSSPWQERFLVFDTLMGRSWDEPFTLYGLLAESIDTSPTRDWVEFTLREAARFSDGSPVTIEDVMWSFETLGTQGHPRYLTAWKNVSSMEQTGDRSVRFTFAKEDRELPLLMGLRPILQRAQWEGHDFDQSGVDLIPVGSGPYVIGDFEPGRYIEFDRNPDYWARDLPFMRGQANFDTVRIDYYGDGDVVFEAFKAGESSTFREGNAAKWAQQYGFPAVQNGDILLAEVPHKRPTGITGFVMNTRNPMFADIRVRDAMMHAFNFEFINQTLNGGTDPRIQSFFHNSVLGMAPGTPATGKVRDLLTPFAADIPPEALDGYALPVSDGSERNRANIRTAMALMEDAGWTIQDGMMKDADGQPFAFEILLSMSASETRQIVDIYAAALGRIGIAPQISTVDAAQYTERTAAFDFDMTWYRRALSLSPGNEQKLYWGAEKMNEDGSRNWMGVASPAIDAMIEAMLTAGSQDDFRAATKALDRLLTAGRYVVPMWYSNVSRLAHTKDIHYPEQLPMYGDWMGFQPDVWWYAE